MKDMSGTLTALVTPFKPNGEIDEASLARLVRQQMDGGVRGFVVCGTTAESPALTEDERALLFRLVRAEAGGDATVMMGTGSNSTAQTIAWTRRAAELGADAALVVAPYYNKPPQRGLVAHFTAVAEASSIPIMLYNVPSRTVVKMEVETIAELSRLPNVFGVKEATGDLEFGRRAIAAVSKQFLVTSGDDATAIELALIGGQGVISVASHVLPRQFVELIARARRGDETASQDFEKYLDLVNYLFCEANPIPVKTALWQMGVIDSPTMRLPLVPLETSRVDEMGRKLRKLGLAR